MAQVGGEYNTVKANGIKILRMFKAHSTSSVATVENKKLTISVDEAGVKKWNQGRFWLFVVANPVWESVKQQNTAIWARENL